MAIEIWKIDDECEPIYFVEIRGPDHELTEAKTWAVEQYGDRVEPYIRNRESRLCGAPRNAARPVILYTTIIFHNVKDVVHFKLTWG